MRPWRASHASSVRLRCILGRAAAWCRVSLRSDRMHAKTPEDPAPDGQRPPQPARAPPAQVKLAGPFYPVRRADRRPAPITRLSHLAPPAGQGPARCSSLTAHHFTSAFPARPLMRPPATVTRPGTGSRRAGDRRRAWTAQHSPVPARPAPAAPRRTPRPPSASPLYQYRATAPPARYRTVPESQPGTEGSKHLQARQRTRLNAAIPHPDSHQHGRGGRLRGSPDCARDAT
jgi:hypothetical protein